MSIRSFYKTASLSQFNKKNVIYIAYVGKHSGRDTFKYGKSSDIFQREYKQHRLTFDTFEMHNIYITNYKDYVETMLEKELKIRDIYTSFKVNNKLQTELFQPTTDYTVEYVDNLVKDIIDEYNKHDEHLLELEKVKLKQMELEYKMKLLDYKIQRIKRN